MTRPDPEVYRLVYVSHVVPWAMLDIEVHMRDILTVAHRLNAADRITGLLLSNGVAFVQVLEGRKQAVEDCYARIVRDPRHTQATVRLRERGEPRFDRWSMCGLTLSALDDALLSPPDIEFDLWKASPKALVQLLAGIAERHGAELDAVHAGLRAAVSHG